MPGKHTRASLGAGGVDPHVMFPVMSHFQPRTQLPTYKSIIGKLRHLTSGGAANMAHSAAVKEVAKLIWLKWYHDTCYCLSQRSIERRLDKLWSSFRKAREDYVRDRFTSSNMKKYIEEIAPNVDKLFDIAATTPEQLAACHDNWGVDMGPNEVQYLEDQRTTRLRICDNREDFVYLAVVLRRKRRLEREAAHRLAMEQQFQGESIDRIEELIFGEGISLTDSSADTPLKQDIQQPEEQVLRSGKRKRLFVDAEAESEAEKQHQIPAKYAHIRDGERKVKDTFYQTVGDLVGDGMSVPEACKAIVKVGKGMFGLGWKEFDEDSEVIDLDTLPDRRNIREKLDLLEVETLARAGDRVSEAAEEGKMITHAIDSTTKRRVGTFATQGIGIGRDRPMPLPLINIAGESTEDIARQVDFGMEVVAAVRGKEAKEVYSEINLHMTDSTQHNKGFAKILGEMYDLDSVAGQAYCSSHTTLGFSSDMNKSVATIERDMRVEEVLSKFMVTMDLDTKNGSLAGQALDMMLKLFAPEYSHKMWNYNRLYVAYLEAKGAEKTLFSYKDQRFGCLSRAAGVLLYNMPYMEMFLNENPHINNKLACLVRELFSLSYLRVVFSVFAAVGVHVVEPFYVNTISPNSTHTSLKKFYMELHTDLGKKQSEDFFKFEGPRMEAVSEELFHGVVRSYGTATITAIKETVQENVEDTLTLLNIILPGLQTVLARQRRDYGLSPEFPAEFPIEEQCADIDQCPVNNLEMERNCGLVDQRLKKLQELQAVSRSLILSRAAALREGKESSFRSFKQELAKKKEITLRWQEETKKKFAAGAEQKQIIAQSKERKRLDILDKLKEVGGPFTDADQVKEYMDSSLVEGEKQTRLKKELQFARESSTTLPSVDPLFRIQVRLPTGRRRDKTAAEFADSLSAFLGKKADSVALPYIAFKSSLQKYSQNNNNNNINNNM